MKHGMKLLLAIGMIAALLCAVSITALAAAPLSHSHYSFDGGAYGNAGSQDNADKTGTEVGAYEELLQHGPWIGDHTNATTHGLSKGFSGSNAVAVPNSGITFAGESFTVSAWFACAHVDGRSNAGTVQRIVSNGGFGDTSGWYIGVLVQNNGNTFVGINVGGAAGVTEFVDVTESMGVYMNYGWNNLTMVADRENNKCHLYLNGSLVKTMDVQDEWYNDATTNAYIGGYVNGETFAEGFCGYLSDIQAVNRAASAEQIAAYIGAAVTDSSVKLASSFPVEEPPVEEPPVEEPPVDTPPETGDVAVNVIAALSVLSAGCVVTVSTLGKKNRK